MKDKHLWIVQYIILFALQGIALLMIAKLLYPYISYGGILVALLFLFLAWKTMIWNNEQ